MVRAHRNGVVQEFLSFSPCSSRWMMAQWTSHFVRSRTSEVQSPTDFCPPFPLHRNLSFPSSSPPFSLIILLTGISLPLSPCLTKQTQCVPWLLPSTQVVAGPDTVLVAQLSTTGAQPQHPTSPRCWFPSELGETHTFEISAPLPSLVNNYPKTKRYWQTGRQHAIRSPSSPGSQTKH